MIWAGMDEDKFLGPCKVCEEAGRTHEDGSPNRLRIIEHARRQALRRLRGLQPRRTRGPDSCDFTRPLPGRGYELWRLEERCSVCGETPRLTVKGFRGRPWKLCLNDDCPTMVEMREKRAEREKAARSEAAKKDGKKGAAKKGAAKAETDGAEQTTPRPPPTAATAPREDEDLGQRPRRRRGRRT